MLGGGEQVEDVVEQQHKEGREGPGGPRSEDFGQPRRSCRGCRVQGEPCARGGQQHQVPQEVGGPQRPNRWAEAAAGHLLTAAQHRGDGGRERGEQGGREQEPGQGGAGYQEEDRRRGLARGHEDGQRPRGRARSGRPPRGQMLHGGDEPAECPPTAQLADHRRSEHGSQEAAAGDQNVGHGATASSLST